MSKKTGKSGQKRVQIVSVNRYRKISLVSNPIILVVLVIMLLFGVPINVVIPVAVVAYAIWAVFFIKGNIEDRRIHGKKR